MVAIKSGQTIWGMVQAKNPGASNAEIAKLTSQVLKNNNLTEASARSIKTGTEIDLSAADKTAAKPTKTPTLAAAPPAPAIATPTTPALLEGLNLNSLGFGSIGSAQQIAGNPFGGITGLPGLDSIFQQFGPLINSFGSNRQDLSQFVSKSQGSLNNLGKAANSGGQFLFGLSGGRVLPFTNPDVVLGNLNLLG